MTPTKEQSVHSEHITITPSIHYVGTPVMLLGTANADGSANLAAASSFWALGQHLVIGLETDSCTYDNVAARPELTVSFPSPAIWEAVERLADTTGRAVVPEAKAARYRYERDKFAVAGLTPVPSELVAPPRVRECALQLEARVLRVTPGMGAYAMVEAEVARVHADPRIVKPGTQHVDPRAWEPLLYSYRHYFALGAEQGFRPTSDTHGEPSQVTG